MNEASIPPNHLTETLVHNQVSGNTDRTCCTSCKPAPPSKGGCTPPGPPPPPPPPMSSISQNGQPPSKVISLLQKWSVWEAPAVQSSPSGFSVVLWEQTGLTSQLECQDPPKKQQQQQNQKNQKKPNNNNNKQTKKRQQPTPTHTLPHSREDLGAQSLTLWQCISAVKQIKPGKHAAPGQSAATAWSLPLIVPVT